MLPRKHAALGFKNAIQGKVTVIETVIVVLDLKVLVNVSSELVIPIFAVGILQNVSLLKISAAPE